MISVVVCTHNGFSRIEPCLSALVTQASAPAYEILIVDNASTDGTGDWVRDYLGQFFPSEFWQVIEEINPGLLSARISGLKAAKYDWVLFCDDDNVLFPDFIFQCQQIICKNSKIGVLGSIGIPELLGPKPTWFDRYASSYAVGPQQVDTLGGKRLVHVYGASSIYCKKPLVDLFNSGFKPVLSGRKGKEMSAGDDVEWCWLMQLMGYKVTYSSRLQFRHQLPVSRLTWEYYLRLKQGISGSAGLLSSYTYFYSISSPKLLGFILHYFFNTLKLVLLYFKYSIRLKGKASKPEEQLAFHILKAKMWAFLNQRGKAISHFRQLKTHFGA